jgi:hypothetical protein
MTSAQDDDWTKATIQTEHFTFELKHKKIQNKYIDTIVFLVGDKSKPCLSLFVPLRLTELGITNSRFQDQIYVATLPYLEVIKECIHDELANDLINKHSFGRELLNFMIGVLKCHFKHIQYLALNDESNIHCGENKKLDLITYSIALYGKTWYESNFNAIQLPTNCEYDIAIKNYIKPSTKASYPFFELARFAMQNMIAHNYFTEHYDELEAEYNSSSTISEFLIALSKKVGKEDKCVFFNVWISNFIKSFVPINRDWYIPINTLPVWQPKRGGSIAEQPLRGRRKNFTKKRARNTNKSSRL